MITVAIAGCTGWTGSAVTKGVLRTSGFKLVSAVARNKAGHDAGEALGLGKAGVTITASLDEALAAKPDVWIDYIGAEGVKDRILAALDKGARVVIGSSGLSPSGFEAIEKRARETGLGAVAAGNFSVTAALAKKCALLAAEYVPHWEIIDYADPLKPDAPSGTTRELADALSKVTANKLDIPVADTLGHKEARGATIAGAQLHSIRLPGYKFSFESVFGLTGERLSIRHDAGEGAEPYVSGTLLAAQKVMNIKGLVRGMDKLLFG